LPWTRQQTTAHPIKFHTLFSDSFRVSCYWRRVTRERKFRSRIHIAAHNWSLSLYRDTRRDCTGRQVLTTGGSSRAPYNSNTAAGIENQKTRKPRHQKEYVQAFLHTPLDNGSDVLLSYRHAGLFHRPLRKIGLDSPKIVSHALEWVQSFLAILLAVPLLTWFSDRVHCYQSTTNISHNEVSRICYGIVSIQGEKGSYRLWL
jgi:hypothetical protein